MARPTKSGLDYFPFDVDFFEDEKIEAISGEFGIKGELTAIKLLCAIYKNGYFVVWCDLLKMKLLKRLPGVNAELLDQIVRRLVRWGFFDKTLFDSANILTSPGIQKRFVEATARRHVRDNRPHWLLDSDPKANEIAQNFVIDDINGVNAYINPRSTGINACINPQSKVNKIKLNTKSQSLGSTARESDSKISDGEATAAAENPIQNFYDSAEEVPTAMTPQKNQASNRIHLDPELNAAIGARRGSFLALLEEIGIKFHLMDGRLMVNELGALVRLLDIPGSVDGVELVRQGLQRLDKAKYITSGRFSNFNASLFLRHDIFIKLINGAYDNIIDVNKNCNRRSERQGKIIEGTDYSGWKDL